VVSNLREEWRGESQEKGRRKKEVKGMGEVMEKWERNGEKLGEEGEGKKGDMGNVEQERTGKEKGVHQYFA